MYPKEHNRWYLYLVQLVENAFKNEKLHYDREQIDKYFSYQKYFPFDLFPWEKCMFILHNCVFKEDGRPRWSDLFIFVGRGAGKNGYLSFEDFCLLTETHGIRNYNIDIYATSEDQAKTSFEEIYEVLELNKKVMKHHFSWNKEVIVNKRTNSKLRYRTKNPDSKDGGRPGKNDFDEEHAYQNSDLKDVANGGLGKKPHPRTTVITTQGYVRGGPLDTDLKIMKEILEGKIPDDGTLPFLCFLEDIEEMHDKVRWNVPNPSLRYRPDLLDRMNKEYRELLNEPTKGKAFIVKRMNVIQEEQEMPVTSWENIVRANKNIVPDLIGQPCIGSIDYAKTTDMVVAGLVFKYHEMIYVIYHVWLCRKSADFKRIKIDKEMFIAQGELTIVESDEISPEIVVNWLEQKSELYNIIFFSMDNFRQTLFKSFLKRMNFDFMDKKKTKLVRPNDIMKVVPVIEHYFTSGLIGWGQGYEHCMMNWFTNNTKLVDAGKGNYVYDKIEPRSRKTDGFMMLVAGIICIDELPEYNDVDFEIEVYSY